MKPKYLEKCQTLYQADFDTKDIFGWVGLPSISLRSFPNTGELEPPFSEPEKFFFAPTEECINRLFPNKNVVPKANPLETAEFYAAQTEILMGLQSLFFRPGGTRIDLLPFVDVSLYASLNGVIEEEMDELERVEARHFFDSLEMTQAEIWKHIVKINQERKGVVIPLRRSIFSLVDPALNLERLRKWREDGMKWGASVGRAATESVGPFEADELFIQLPEGKGLRHHYIASILPQCTYSREAVSKAFQLS